MGNETVTAPDINGPVPGGDGGLASALGTSQPAAPQPEPTSNAPLSGTLTPPSGGGNLASTLQPAVNPKLNRTLLNTIKGIALGFMEGNIPGAIQGAIDPSVPQRVLQQRRDTAQANVAFSSAQASHMVAQAAMEDKHLQSFDEDHRLAVTKSNLDIMQELQNMGISPIATTTMDKGSADNTKSAMANLQSVTASHGAVPPTMTLHVGNQSVSYDLNQLALTGGTLDQVNRVRQITGQPPLDTTSWNQMAKTAQGIAMASDAWKFFAPMPTEDNLTQYKNFQANLQNQPQSAARDANIQKIDGIVTTMQKLLDERNTRSAKLKGQAAGIEATEAQPGQTAAKVAEIQETAGPEAKAAGEKAGAVAKAQFPTQLALEKAKLGGNPVYAYDPQQKATVLTTRSDATDRNLSAVRNVTQPEIEKDSQMARQLGDAQMNLSAYRVSAREMGDLSSTDKSRIASMMSNPQLKIGLWGTEIPTNWLGTLSDSSYWKQLSPQAQDAMVGYVGARGSIIAYAKAISGSGKLTESQLETELRNLPDPTVPADVREKQFERFQRNIDQAASGIPKIPGVDLPSEIRQRIESQAKTAPTPPQGKYKSAQPVKEGQNIQVSHVPGLSTVRKVYSDGTFDADQKP